MPDSPATRSWTNVHRVSTSGWHDAAGGAGNPVRRRSDTSRDGTRVVVAGRVTPDRVQPVAPPAHSARSQTCGSCGGEWPFCSMSPDVRLTPRSWSPDGVYQRSLFDRATLEAATQRRKVGSCRRRGRKTAHRRGDPRGMPTYSARSSPRRARVILHTSGWERHANELCCCRRFHRPGPQVRIIAVTSGGIERDRRLDPLRPAERSSTTVWTREAYSVAVDIKHGCPRFGNSRSERGCPGGLDARP